MDGLGGGAFFLAAATTLALGGSGLFGGPLLVIGEAVEGFGQSVDRFLVSSLLVIDGETAFDVVCGGALLVLAWVGEAPCLCGTLVSSSVTGLLSTF